MFIEPWHKIKPLLVLDLSTSRLREHNNSVNSAWTYVYYIINAYIKEVISSTSYRLNCKNGKEKKLKGLRGCNTNYMRNFYEAESEEYRRELVSVHVYV